MTDQRVGIYIRLSLADGDGKAESDSIGNQRELIHQFLDRHPQLKTAPRTEFVDDGYTGTNTDRPQFQALMKELRTGVINVMVTKDFPDAIGTIPRWATIWSASFPSWVSAISPSMTATTAMITRA